jgi:hypothetical protein
MNVYIPVATDSSDYVATFIWLTFQLLLGPRIISCPSFAIAQTILLKKLAKKQVTQRSSLVLEGEELFVNNLDLDGMGGHVPTD